MIKLVLKYRINAAPCSVLKMQHLRFVYLVQFQVIRYTNIGSMQHKIHKYSFSSEQLVQVYTQTETILVKN
jgi:hypothetical protein